MRLRVPRLFWVAAAVFVLLTVLVAAGLLDDADRDVLDFCLRHDHPTLASGADHLTNVFSPPRDAAVLGIGAGSLAWLRRRPRPFLIAALTGWATAAIVYFIKNWVGRPLPHSLEAPHHGGGFPSGHTASFLVCYGVLALIATRPGGRSRRTALAAVAIGTLVIAAALVYDGFHWLSDTVGSMALGVALLSLLARNLTTSPASPQSDADA
jgi:membrane-associated phospholipid phosphatase